MALTPQEIATQGTCWDCALLPPSAQTYLIYQVYLLQGGTEMTVQELIDAAKCYECIPPGMQAAVQTYLLNQISGNSTGGFVSCGAGDPTGDTGPTCQLYLNTTDDSLWAKRNGSWVELIS